MTVIYEWLFAGLFWIGLLLLIVGTILLLVPSILQPLVPFMNRWIETDSLFNRLDEPVRLERLFYRHHRIMGLLIVAGAAYCLYSLWLWVDLLTLFSGSHSGSELGWSNILVDAAIMVLTLGNILSLIVGVIVILRPSLLKGLESRANTWIESDQFFQSLDTRIDMTEHWLNRHPRLIGLLVIIGSLYMMSNTAIIALQ